LSTDRASPSYPTVALDEHLGAWPDEPAWPPERAGTLPLRLSGAAPAGDGADRLEVRGDVGSAAWISCAGHLPFGQPDDQRVELELDATSWVFPAGHRLRLSLAGSDWPNLVPPPAPVTLTVERDGSVLTLPVLDGPSPCPPPSLPPPRPGEPEADPRLAGGRAMSPPDPPTRWRVVRDVLGRTSEAEIDHGGRSELPTGRCWSSATAGRSGPRSGRG
jgi:uncharacterized protein